MGTDMDKQEQPTEAKSIKGFFQSRYPDIAADDENSLYDRISSDYDRSDKEHDGLKRFNELLTKDDRMAGLITGMAAGVKEDGSPFSIAEYLLSNYADEIYGAQDPREAAKKAAEHEARLLEEAQEEEQRKQTRQKNFEACDAAFEKAAKALGVNDKDAEKFLKWLYEPEKGFIHRVWTYDIDESDWEKLLKVFTYDNAVTKAEENGYKRGRNDRIDMAKRKDMSRAELPSDLGESGASINSIEKDPTLSAYSKMKPRI